jgi:PKD repeat protein
MKTKFTILLFLLLGFQIGKSQFVTDFIADNTSACAPIAVSFTSSSNISPTSWYWDFGTGTTSTQENPLHLFINPGIYTVTLIVSNGVDYDTITKPNYISANPPPIVDFTYIMSGDTVQFIDQTPGGIAQWSWNLGNGTTANYPNPLTTYPYPPDSCYKVILNIQNFYGCIDTLSKTICIDSTISINEVEKNSISIYPSPIINNQKLIVKGNINGLGNIIGYDVLGNLISFPIISKNENEIIFETNQLDKGVYFLQLHFDDKTVITKKIVVQ